MAPGRIIYHKPKEAWMVFSCRWACTRFKMDYRLSWERLQDAALRPCWLCGRRVEWFGPYTDGEVQRIASNGLIPFIKFRSSARALTQRREERL